eukprot:TRINITY_DN229_c0_g1_i7.p1 TRINITY_DN229_c0_g1~~TRINITY_DN229_c0_g1_i7.p1  ORF type:complete len:160 (+),score=44.11 TRINITY_DN229_c0_g1_i7:143-622(+)
MNACLFGSRLLVVSDVPGVDHLARVPLDWLDEASLEELSDSTTCKRAIDLQSLGDGGWGNQFEVLYLNQHTVIGLLVEDDQVVKLLAYLPLGPLLLLLSSSLLGGTSLAWVLACVCLLIFLRSHWICLLYTSDAADDLLCVDLGGRRIIKKKKKTNNNT